MPNPKRLAAYLFNATRPLLVLIALILFCLFGASVLKLTPEGTLRWTGMTLQMAGFILALVDIESTRRIMGGRDFIDAWKTFLDMFAGPKTVNISGTMAMSMMLGDVRIHVGRNSEAPVEHRVSRLEADIDRLEQQVAQVSKTTTAEHAVLKKDIEDGLSKIREDVRSLAERLKDALSGGYFMQVVGVGYFVFGVGLASTSVEVACWVFHTCPAA